MRCVYCGQQITSADRWASCPAAGAVGGFHDTMTLEQRAARVAAASRHQERS